MMEEASFGVIPVKKEQGNWKVLLIFHQGGRHWGFPKGHQHGQETALESALRELKEETGLEVARLLAEEPYVESYFFYKQQLKVHKTVSYFPAIVTGDLLLQPEEILDASWLSFQEAVDRLTFIEAKNICRKVEKIVMHLE